MVQRVLCNVVCFFQAEDGIRDLVRSRGLGDVYKRQPDEVRLEWWAAALVLAGYAALLSGFGIWRTTRALSLIHI